METLMVSNINYNKLRKEKSLANTTKTETRGM